MTDVRRLKFDTQQAVSTITTSNETDVVINIPIGQSGEVAENTDLYSNSNTTNATQETNKRTENELYKSIEALCKKYGLDINQAKQMGLFQILLGKTPEELLDLNSVPQSMLNEAVKKIENAINAIFEDIADIKNGDKKLTFELIINYTKLLDGNIPEGYENVDDFRKAQKRLNDKNTTAAESITERIKRANGKDISTMSPDEAKNEIYKYLKAYFDDKIKAGGNIEEITRSQLRDFSKLIFNSSQEELKLLVEAIQYLLKDNIIPGINEVIDNCHTDEKRTEIADTFTTEKKETLVTKPDFAGKVGDANLAEGIAKATTPHKSRGAIEQELKDIDLSAEKFYTPETVEKLKNITAEQIDQIKEKIKNNENITPEEQEIFDLYTKNQYFKGNFRGNILGILNNENIDDTDFLRILTISDELLNKININSNNLFKDDILNRIKDALESNNDKNLRSEILENFINNESIEGTSLCGGAPINTIINNYYDDNSATTYYSNQYIGYTIPEIQNQNLNNNNLVQDFYNKSNEEDSDNNESILIKNPIKLQPQYATIDKYIREYGLTKGFTKYINDNGSLASVLNDTKNSVVEKLALERYKRNNSSLQLLTLRNLCSRALSLVLNHSKDNTIEKAGDMIFANSYSTELVRDAAEKLKEEKPEQFA